MAKRKKTNFTSMFDFQKLDVCAREGDLFFEGKEESKVFPEVFSIQSESQLIPLCSTCQDPQQYMCVCPQCVFVYEYTVYAWVRSAWPLDSPADCLSPSECVWSLWQRKCKKQKKQRSDVMREKRRKTQTSNYKKKRMKELSSSTQGQRKKRREVV